MANQTADRKYKSIRGKAREMPVAATELFKVGSAVFRNATGYMTRPAAVGDVAMGITKESVDNSSGADGALNVIFETGCFSFAISGSDAVTIADVGNVVYAEDDQTIAKTDATGTLPAMGTMAFIDGGLAYVQVGLVAQED